MTDALAKLQLNGVLREYGLILQQAEPASGGFSGARVWRVATSQGPVVALRCSEPVSPELQQQRTAVCRWMRWAREQGCNWSPRPLELVNATATGGAFFLQRGELIWQAEEWMPGTPVAANPSSRQLRAALRTIAQLHQSGRDFVLRYGVSGGLQLAIGKSPGLERRLQIVQSLLNGELEQLLMAAGRHTNAEFRQLAGEYGRSLRERLQGLERQLRQIVREDFILQPILRDIWKPHMLFAEADVTGVIDWNAAAADHPAFDYARLLCSWYGSDILNADSVSEQLPDAWNVTEQQLWRLCCQSVLLLSPVTWLRRICANAELPPTSELLTTSMLQRFREVVAAINLNQ